ncbi:MAG: hypothetical protein ACFE9L_00175 [Candidatus Hodarchaeota archaeon]
MAFNLFVSYCGIDRSRVVEAKTELRRAGSSHPLIDDVDLGDLRQETFEERWPKIRAKLKACGGAILLEGDDTHSPRITLNKELSFAISKGWPIFGISLSRRTGDPPPRVKDYKYYIPLDYDFPNIVSEITKYYNQIE